MKVHCLQKHDLMYMIVVHGFTDTWFYRYMVLQIHGFNYKSVAHCFLDTDDCKGVTCENGGTCVDQRRDYICLCLQAYTGKHCEHGKTSCCKVPTVGSEVWSLRPLYSKT